MWAVDGQEVTKWMSQMRKISSPSIRCNTNGESENQLRSELDLPYERSLSVAHH